MKTLRIVQFFLFAASIAACTTSTQKRLDTVSRADSIHVDSLETLRNELVEALNTSAEFMNDINSELSRVRGLAAKPTLTTTAEIPDPNLERNAVVAKIAYMVARLDSVQTRLASSRTQLAQLSRKDSALIVKVAEYEKSIADLQAAVEGQRIESQQLIDGQASQIATLTSEVGALKTTRLALGDSVGRMTVEKNTAYVVVGTKEELIKKGILVAEGSKRFVVVGSRPVKPARNLDPSAFTRIDRTVDRTIVLPAGKYEILSRQNPTYASPAVPKTGKISGVMVIEQPEQFWEASPFLIIVQA
jgi:hypothetical protein